MRSTRVGTGDTKFLIALGLLVALGLIFLSSASGPLAFEHYRDSSYYFKRQIFFGVIPGILAFFICSRLQRRILERIAIPFLVVGIFFLVLIFIPGLGVTHGRTRSWLALGPLIFQPAEIAKLGLIFALAALVTIRRPEWFDIRSFTRGFIPFFALFAIPMLLLALQPDVGTMLIITAIGVTVFFAAGARWLHLGAVIAAGIMAFAGLIAAAPYRLARLTTFLHPELDPQGIGYQINQALLAIGSGGITGLGLGHSRQKFLFLPEVIADSVFAIVAEELGFILTVAFLVLFVFVIWRVFANALAATDAFERLVLVGIGTWWCSQAIVNVGAMVNLLPLTGLPLPFVSYGGTSMVMSLAAAGVVYNISRQPQAASRKLGV